MVETPVDAVKKNDRDFVAWYVLMNYGNVRFDSDLARLDDDLDPQVSLFVWSGSKDNIADGCELEIVRLSEFEFGDRSVKKHNDIRRQKPSVRLKTWPNDYVAWAVLLTLGDHEYIQWFADESLSRTNDDVQLTGADYHTREDYFYVKQDDIDFYRQCIEDATLVKT